MNLYISNLRLHERQRILNTSYRSCPNFFVYRHSAVLISMVLIDRRNFSLLLAAGLLNSVAFMKLDALRTPLRSFSFIGA
jgi:hypothetical protein